MICSILKSGLQGSRAKPLALIICAAGLMTMAGCGSSGSETSLTAQGPVALTPAPEASGGGGPTALVGKIDEAELRQAVDRYRLVKQRAPAQYDFAGVDLNGDGRPEAVVLFAGPDWCQRTGCSMVVFQQEKVGYRPVSHVISVRPPILVGPDSSFGWRDLMVGTGGGPSPVRTVRLGFTGKGYPANALLQPEPVAEMLSKSQPVLSESPAFAAVMNQPRS